MYIGTLEQGIKEIPLNSDQTITFEVSDKLVGDAPFALNATATSGLAVVWSSSDPSILSVDGNGMATVHKAGTVPIRAVQSGICYLKVQRLRKR